MKDVTIISGQINFMELIDKIIDSTNNDRASEVHIEFNDGGKKKKIVGKQILSPISFHSVDDDKIINGSEIKKLVDGESIGDSKTLTLKSDGQNRFRIWSLSAI